ncbi:hypothetical protein [Yinghuangia soli]|uniref:Uncharacterized protein n=1 Tax=Yinghuangia soli TaxID=2908204 RepID=A0AA41U7F2_9ACTN|nr:hypothetical protein [Yinghuangia soli]MCF2533987.1 hypothetical protein [Yinghuangia soli]
MAEPGSGEQQRWIPPALMVHQSRRFRADGVDHPDRVLLRQAQVGGESIDQEVPASLRQRCDHLGRRNPQGGDDGVHANSPMAVAITAIMSAGDVASSDEGRARLWVIGMLDASRWRRKSLAPMSYSLGKIAK